MGPSLLSYQTNRFCGAPDDPHGYLRNSPPACIIASDWWMFWSARGPAAPKYCSGWCSAALNEIFMFAPCADSLSFRSGSVSCHSGSSSDTGAKPLLSNAFTGTACAPNDSKQAMRHSSTVCVSGRNSTHRLDPHPSRMGRWAYACALSVLLMAVSARLSRLALLTLSIAMMTEPSRSSS